MRDLQKSLKAYGALVDLCAKARYMVKHSANEFAKGRNHINEIVNFFVSCYILATVSKSGFAKFRLAKFNVSKRKFCSSFKRNKIKTKNLRQYSHQNLLKLISQNPVKVS